MSRFNIGKRCTPTRGFLQQHLSLLCRWPVPRTVTRVGRPVLSGTCVPCAPIPALSIARALHLTSVSLAGRHSTGGGNVNSRELMNALGNLKKQRLQPKALRQKVMKIDEQLERLYLDRKQVSLSSRDLSSLLGALNRAGLYESTIQWFQRVKEMSTKLNNIHFSQVITASRRNKQGARAIAYLGEMTKRGIEPDTITYSACISACEKGGKWEKALSLLSEMVDKGIAPDTITYSGLIDVCMKTKQKERGLAVYANAYANGFKEHWKSRAGLLMDLHDHSRYSASAAVQHAFNELLPSNGKERKGLWESRKDGVNSVRIITGKGIHSKVMHMCGVVRAEVERVLEEELRPSVSWVEEEGNSGVVVVNRAEIERWLRAERE